MYIRHEKPEKYGIKFDSKLELVFYEKLVAAGVEFEYQPEPFILVEKFKATKFDHTKEVQKLLRIQSRDAVTKADKTTVKRLINRDFEKTMVEETVAAMRMTVDWKIGSFYVETKGHPNDQFPVKWKFLRSKYPEHTFVLIKTQKDMDDFIKMYKSGRENADANS